MATNPMQRKARNSILIGILIGLLIGAAICALLFMQLKKVQDEMKAEEAMTRKVYVATADIKAGAPIDVTMFTEKEANIGVIPSDYIGISGITEKTIAKVDIASGSVISKSLIEESDEKTTSDLREQQYNMIVLPQYLDVDDYIDIRLTMPNGQDYVVVSRKRIKQITEDTIWINMYEEETLAMTNAIVESYICTGSKLYATRYVEPGIQTDVTPTYVPSAEVINLINADKNVTDEAKRALAARYTTELRTRRENDIQSQLNTYSEEAKENVESNLEQEITKAKNARQEYVDSLNGAAVQ